MNEQKEALEKAGYQFIIDETESKDPDGRVAAFYQVQVYYNGRLLGSRSEVTAEAALERAIELAELHQQDPVEADEETLDKSAYDR